MSSQFSEILLAKLSTSSEKTLLRVHNRRYFSQDVKYEVLREL